MFDCLLDRIPEVYTRVCALLVYLFSAVKK